MKTFFAAFVVTGLCATGAMAQTPPPTPAQSSSPSESSPADASLTGGTVINATLKSSVDSKKAKPGSPVTAQTTEAVKSVDGRTVLPKGTKLTGHVTQASAAGKGENQSALGIQFDKAQLKGGQEMPLTNLSIQAVAAPAHETSNYGTDTGTTAQPGMPTSTSGAPANNPSMAGSRGARPEGTPPSTATPQPYPSGNPGATAGNEGNSAGPLPPNTRGVYGIEGVRIAPAQNGEGTLLTSTGKNVHLDSGTRLLLVVRQQGGNASPGR